MEATKQADWSRVPFKARELFVRHLPDARRLDERFPDPTTPLEIPTEAGMVVVKRAAAFEPAARMFGDAQRWLGGVNPLTAMLVGGGLGSALGYGAGTLAEQLMPRKYLERGRLRRNLALLGGLGGAAIPGYLYGRPMVGEHGVRGLLMQGPYGRETTPTVKEALESAAGDDDVDPDMTKAAASAYGAALPQIPRDDFNRVVLRDPFLPDELKAMTTGVVGMASASRGGADWVSPLDVARLATGMGTGAVSGMLVGNTLGALAGLSDEAVSGIQRAGVFAGLLSNVVPMLFR